MPIYKIPKGTGAWPFSPSLPMSGMQHAGVEIDGYMCYEIYPMVLTEIDWFFNDFYCGHPIKTGYKIILLPEKPIINGREIWAFACGKWNIVGGN